MTGYNQAGVRMELVEESRNSCLMREVVRLRHG
jgi:hypothetical protein